MPQRFLHWFLNPHRRALKLLVTAVLLFAAYQAIQAIRAFDDPRNQAFLQWATGTQAEREELITIQREACPDAPFILPADGFIGLLYNDPRGPYSRANPHQGIDIFSDSEPGITPVYAAYDGYITREPDWRSTLIQRVPDDPLHPGRQIWLYYTHMADVQGNDFIEAAFAPGTRDLFVEQGTLLGYTGNYSGNPVRGVGVHLHFSIVLDNGNGRYLNELHFPNTIDSSPYLGINVNYACTSAATGCAAVATC